MQALLCYERWTATNLSGCVEDCWFSKDRFPRYNLSVTFGDTSPCRRGFGIPQTLPLRQRLPYQGSWHCEAMTERFVFNTSRSESLPRKMQKPPPGGPAGAWDAYFREAQDWQAVMRLIL